jgi:hypothetical protein
MILIHNRSMMKEVINDLMFLYNVLILEYWFSDEGKACTNYTS